KQLGVAHSQACRQAHALMIVVIADALMHELLGNRSCQLVAMLLGNDVQHHVEGGRPPGAGEAVAVDLEELVADIELGKLLHEGGQIFPMDRAGHVVQQASLGEDVGSGAHGTQGAALPRHPAQPGDEAPVVDLLNVHAAAERDGLKFARRFKIPFRGKDQPAGGGNGFAVDGEDGPAIKFAIAQTIGLPQGFDGSGKGDHRKTREEDETDGLGKFLGRITQHSSLWSRAAETQALLVLFHKGLCREMETSRRRRMSRHAEKSVLLSRSYREHRKARAIPFMDPPHIYNYRILKTDSRTLGRAGFANLHWRALPSPVARPPCD